jgi:hypothetical protein
MPTLAGFLSIVVLILHYAFVLFVALGGTLALLKPTRFLIAAHLLCVAWGAVSLIFVMPCPLTWTENVLRRSAGWQAYPSGCIDMYLPKILDALHLPQIGLYKLAIIALLINITSYALLWQRSRGIDGIGAARSQVTPSRVTRSS